MNPQSPLDRLLSLLDQPDPSAQIATQPHDAIAAHSLKLRGPLAQLGIADLSSEQVQRLAGRSFADAADLLSEVAELVSDLPAAAKALDTSAQEVTGVAGLLLALGGLERGYAAVFEGADIAALHCADQGYRDLKVVHSAAEARIAPGSAASAVERALIISRASELAQLLAALDAAPAQKTEAPSEVVVLRDAAEERALRDRFLSLVRVAQEKAAPLAPAATEKSEAKSAAKARKPRGKAVH